MKNCSHTEVSGNRMDTLHYTNHRDSSDRWLYRWSATAHVLLLQISA